MPLFRFDPRYTNKKQQAIQDFGTALKKIVDSIPSNNNQKTLLTVFPGTQAAWNRIQPVEGWLPTDDILFSSQIWKTGYETNSRVVPINEYFLFNPSDLENYFSGDGGHPTSTGHQKIAEIMKKFNKPVSINETTLNNINKDQYSTLKAADANFNDQILGQVIFYENDDKFKISVAFVILPNGIFYTNFPDTEGITNVISKQTNKAIVYSNYPIEAKDFQGSLRSPRLINLPTKTPTPTVSQQKETLSPATLIQFLLKLKSQLLQHPLFANYSKIVLK